MNEPTEPGTDLTLAEYEPPEQSRALADFRAQAMSASPERMKLGLAEYSLRRKTFRDWLKEQLIEGLHFGYPPGCEPKLDDRGWYGVWSKGGMKFYPPSQWVPKPSLYKSGADFMVDLMDLLPKYTPDATAWQMGGSLPGHFFVKCELLSKNTGAVVGEGLGSGKVTSQMDANAAVKMAQKCAKVCAVLDAYGLSDLFTQDLEHGAGKEEHPTPEKRPEATKTQPRGKRVTPDQLKAVCVRYRTWITNDTLKAPTPEQLAEYASKSTGVEFTVATVLKSDNWTQEALQKFSDEVAKHEPPEGI